MSQLKWTFTLRIKWGAEPCGIIEEALISPREFVYAPAACPTLVRPRYYLCFLQGGLGICGSSWTPLLSSISFIIFLVFLSCWCGALYGGDHPNNQQEVQKYTLWLSALRQRSPRLLAVGEVTKVAKMSTSSRRGRGRGEAATESGLLRRRAHSYMYKWERLRRMGQMKVAVMMILRMSGGGGDGVERWCGRRRRSKE
jgi:hypothetical protein